MLPLARAKVLGKVRIEVGDLECRAKGVLRLEAHPMREGQGPE